MGELHLDVIVDRLKREFKVEVNQGQPQVEYKEAITQSADHREVYKKQSGGRGKFADIVFTVELWRRRSEVGLQFESDQLKVVTFLRNLYLQLKKDSSKRW